ncbi:Mif2/CENP-C like-domain-containing protein [Cristinia sonorae]|uniref:CENP-C homolog n=1 Tax=Cristinia sonorae TaxID=1940300 RepID=A0A8K0UZU0_9AGAR|nr:Mif2/CENP-C like-domain-containing protein [Cristinia sonorae]
MPTSVRKSSLGAARRGPQPYIPYRGDDFQHGKRTGIAVAMVDHSSDDFEPFEEVLKQADARTPPRPKIQARKKRGPKTPVVEEPEYDENGEMDMDIVDSTQNSPAIYFSNTRVPAITSSVQRVGSSSRPVHRSSDVDFDEVPSPRRPMSALSGGRRSLGLGLSRGPSRLSTATNPRDLADGLDIDDNFDGGNYNLPDADDSDNDPMVSPPPAPLHRRRSFQQMDQEEEEVVEEEQVEEEVEGEVEEHVTPSAKAKGKQRQVVPDEDIELPDAFDQGYGDLGPADDQEQEPEEEREETPKPKKARGKRKDNDENVEEKPKPKRKRPADGILREVIQDNNQDHSGGVRRGARTRYAPLDWWRNEKVVYGRRESGPCLVPNIKEIHRVPKPEVVPLGKYAKKKRRAQSKAKSMDPEGEYEEGATYNPEEGWDDDTPQQGIIHDYEQEKEVEKRVAFTAKMLDLKPAANNDFFFQKIFGDGDFIAAGQLVIPPKKQKPTKGTKDNTFIFYVIEGAVNFKVHRTSFVLTTGGMFLVPRGNMYFIQNISDRDAKLFFAQARKMPVEMEDGEEERPSTSRSPSKERRSESVKRAMSEATAITAKIKAPKPKRAASRA